MEDVLKGLADDVRRKVIEVCAKIADGVMNDADAKAADLSYGELYGMNCRSDAAKEIAAAIRTLAD